MNRSDLRNALSDLPLGDLRFFPSIGSTNDEALVWAAQGAPDLSLVIADEQTAGRGRSGRKWFTPRGSALALSLILRPAPAGSPHHTRTVGLAALAVAECLQMRDLAARIKWPNDVLIDDKKVAGILLESIWIGAQIDFSIVGIGLNVARSSVPPPDVLNYPATSLEEQMNVPPERESVLHDLLACLLRWREKMERDEFIAAWDGQLAFRGRQVQVWEAGGPVMTGKVLGLEPDGSLRLEGENGEPMTVYFGDVRLRPAV